jgi:hypothetical protein
MMIAGEFVKTTTLTNIPAIVCGFLALFIPQTMGLIWAGYALRKPRQ